MGDILGTIFDIFFNVITSGSDLIQKNDAFFSHWCHESLGTTY